MLVDNSAPPSWKTDFKFKSDPEKGLSFFVTKCPLTYNLLLLNFSLEKVAREEKEERAVRPPRARRLLNQEVPRPACSFPLVVSTVS
jgi:hypothetical protein